jgi:hypothetical protein
MAPVAETELTTSPRSTRAVWNRGPLDAVAPRTTTLRAMAKTAPTTATAMQKRVMRARDTVLSPPTHGGRRLRP